MNDSVVAYAFPLGADASSQLRAFYSSFECREVLGRESSSVQAIVCDKGEINPINLVAALCLDSPERDVYLMSDALNADLISRARAAGAREVLSGGQVEQMLGFVQGGPTTGGVQGGPTTGGVQGGQMLGGAQGEQTLSSSQLGQTQNGVRDDSALLPPLPSSSDCAASSRETSLSRETAPPRETAAPPQETSPSQESAPLRETAALSPRSSTQGLLVGVFAGRGGVGKSVVALMLGILAGRRGLRVAVVDLDLQFGDMSYLAGREEHGSLRKVSITELTGGASCSRGTLEVPSGELLVVEAPNQPEQAELLFTHIPDLLNDLTRVCDLVIANTSSFFSDIHAELARRCSHLIFLMDQRSTSVTACKQAMELCVRLQVPQARFLFALNGCGRYAALGTQDVSLALGGMEVCELADGGTLVDELLALGCPGELAISGNAFITSLAALLDQLTSEYLVVGAHDQPGMGRMPAAKQKKAGLAWGLSSLLGLFSGRERLDHVAS
ncbi:MAG: P-loop NTPase [Coriobacteriales bacterium]|jgi:pilus assembly protein CpaE|nr:P-loop NTPase [Coriobacteriales bacterium]